MSSAQAAKRHRRSELSLEIRDVGLVYWRSRGRFHAMFYKEKNNAKNEDAGKSGNTQRADSQLVFFSWCIHLEGTSRRSSQWTRPQFTRQKYFWNKNCGFWGRPPGFTSRLLQEKAEGLIKKIESVNAPPKAECKKQPVVIPNIHRVS